jgi:ATP-dependent DNA ligase
VNEQEFVIGGYTDPRGSRVGFGALLVGYYEGGVLRYAGKVGTGYSEATLRDLAGRLVALEQDEPAFAGDGLPRSGVHWVRLSWWRRSASRSSPAIASCATLAFLGCGATSAPVR